MNKNWYWLFWFISPNKIYLNWREDIFVNLNCWVNINEKIFIYLHQDFKKFKIKIRRIEYTQWNNWIKYHTLKIH